MTTKELGLNFRTIPKINLWRTRYIFFTSIVLTIITNSNLKFVGGVVESPRISHTDLLGSDSSFAFSYFFLCYSIFGGVQRSCEVTRYRIKKIS